MIAKQKPSPMERLSIYVPKILVSLISLGSVKYSCQLARKYSK